MRLATLLVILPSLLLLAGVGAPSAAPKPIAQPVNLWDLGILAIGGGLGAWAFNLMKAPAASLFGSMVAGALLFGSGLVSTGLPDWLMIPGFIAIGASVGANFVGTSRQLFVETLPASIGTVIVGACMAMIVALPVALLLGLPTAQVWLAYAPGGVDVMAIMALALGLDAAYVGGHHLVRFLGLGLFVPFWLKAYMRRDAAQ